MAMQLRQVPRLTQRLVITPRMQLSLKLLQLNQLELETLTRQELEQNPYLETQEMETGNTDGVARSQTEEEPSRAREVADSVQAAEGEDTRKPEETYSGSFERVDMDWDDYYSDSENRSYYQPSDDREYTDFTEYTSSSPSLYEHLHYQLRLSPLEGHDTKIGEFIIGSLDHNGFLSVPVEEIAEQFKVPTEKVEEVLDVIQGLEPTGIGARDIRECLVLQLEERGETDPLVYEIVRHHFDALLRKKFSDIARATGVTKKDVIRVYESLSHLDPRPARNYTTEPPHYITPDVIVEKDEDTYHVFLNEDTTSNLRINSYYRRLLNKNTLGKDEKKYAMKKFNAAVWLIKNIERRRDTILKTSRAIIDMQRDFFDKGIGHLKSLTLRDVAERIDMHESTVQRVTTGKYMQTPRGLYELKFFFSSGVDRADGESTSSTAVKDHIARIIDQEDPAKPLSDRKISEMLKEKGIQVARRTVAKYREQLKILPAKLRRGAW